jgi:hypothetical protein
MDKLLFNYCTPSSPATPLFFHSPKKSTSSLNMTACKEILQTLLCLSIFLPLLNMSSGMDIFIIFQ